MPYIKMNSEWIKDLHGRAKTYKVLVKEHENLYDLTLDDDFLAMTPKIQAIKQKM